MGKILLVILAIAAFVALFAGGVLLGGLIFMVCWNAFVPAALGGSTISFWTAVAGSFLIWLIGGSFRSIIAR